MTLHALLRRWRGETGTVQPEGWARSVGRTHVGRVRTVNEDRLLDRADRRLWAIADGMGGHSAGDVAATLTVEALNGLADDAAPLTPASVIRALEGANAVIHARARASGTTSGATVVVVLLDGPEATIFWAGDSRAYLLREDAAERLTRDHSVVQALVDARTIDAAAAERHPQANLITRALGVAPTIEIDTCEVALRAGDRLLLCSDGLSRSLAGSDFATLPDGLEPAADTLMTNALRRDGSDNVTLMLIAPTSGS